MKTAGDRIIYYAKKKVVTEIFKVISDLYLSPKKVYGEPANRIYVYDLEPIYKLTTEKPIQINPADYGFEHKQRTVVKLTHDQYKGMVSDILGMDEPKSENGVISLFAKIHRELGFPFLKVLGDRFPDCIALNNEIKEVKIEFEKRSSDFDHDPKECDYIVCWVNDLGAMAQSKLLS